MPKRETLVRTGAATAIGALLLSAHAAYYWPFIADDAFISLRYAQNLVAGHGLVWNAGERVEGYSNLLFVLITAGLQALGCDLVSAARAVGCVSTLVAIACIAHLAAPAGFLAQLGSVALLAALAPVAIWTIAGLETTLLCALAVAAWTAPMPDLRSRRRRLAAGTLLGFAAWTRPDGVLFAAALGLALAYGDRRDDRVARPSARLFALAPVIVPSVVMALLQSVFRWIYYHDYIPNVARIKLEGGWHRALEGLAYVGDGLVYTLPLVALAVTVTVIARRKRHELALVWSAFGLWLLYIAGAGGDILPAKRHMAPALVALVAVVAAGAEAWPQGRVALPLVAAGVLALGFKQPANAHAKKESWEQDGEAIGLALKATFGKAAPLVAAPVAGSLPFFSELPAIDTLGLNDAHIARQPPLQPSGDLEASAWVGHTHGDAAYVLARRPDLIMWCGVYSRQRPCFAGETQMAALPQFRSDYGLAWFAGLPPRQPVFSMFVRVESPKVGYRQDARRVVVPAYLAGTSPSQPATVAGDRWTLPLVPGRPVHVPPLRLPPGTWQLALDASPGATARSSTGAPLPLTMTLGPNDHFGQLLTVEEEGRLYGLVFTRVD